MASEGNSSDTDLSSDISQVPIPRFIRLAILLVMDIPSSICTIFILLNIFKNRLLRKSLYNHVIIAILLSILPTQLIDIPFHIIYLSLDYVWPSNPIFCLFWLFISVGIFDTTGILMAYATIERHILIFHDRWLINKKRRIFIHYIPLYSVVIYSLIFYIYVILFPPCLTNFDYTQPWCSYPCYYDNNILSMYDSIVNVVLPAFIIVFFSIALLLRFIIRRRQLNLKNKWKKYRRMIIQITTMSSLLIIFNLPLTILMLAHLCGLSSDIGIDFSQYAYFFTYFIPLLMPFICLQSLPEIYRKLIKIFLNYWQKIRQQLTATVTPMM
ncbi:unnamed protein product [Adineta steineri]|uniref:G-protein coupled receptors family 1 profile domain-containing protein n=1 Tax=Adineta steineri TaxID=433720 RepID=A0A814NUA5_9BILA|nr:unnamed protein product [Adineta steineri]CAF4029029.1 unnamed protein product [Adineta steineri]